MSNSKTFYPGVYDCTFPFVGNQRDIGHVDVVIHIGENTGINKGTGFFVTTVVRSTEQVSPAVEHFIEEICTKIRLSLFDRLLGENAVDGDFWAEDKMRWFQVLPYYRQGAWKQVNMKWDATRNRFTDPQWTAMENLVILDSNFEG